MAKEVRTQMYVMTHNGAHGCPDGAQLPNGSWKPSGRMIRLAAGLEGSTRQAMPDAAYGTGRFAAEWCSSSADPDPTQPLTPHRSPS